MSSSVTPVLRAELVKQLLRRRSVVILAGLAALPLVAAAATASRAGGRNGTQGGLYGASPFSALNHVAATLEFATPLLLALAVALLGSAIGAADREWGTLRYLYVQPVGQGRLLGGKWSALVVCCLAAVACLLVTALICGLVVFGWHPFHRLGTSTLSAPTAAARMAGAGAYVIVCTLSVATVAFALGLLLPGPAEAVAASVVLVVASSIVDGQTSLHVLASVLPVHYWTRWTALLEGGPSGLLEGVAVQAVWTAGTLALAWALLARRDPIA